MTLGQCPCFSAVMSVSTKRTCDNKLTAVYRSIRIILKQKLKHSRERCNNAVLTKFNLRSTATLFAEIYETAVTLVDNAPWYLRFVQRLPLEYRAA